MSPALRARYPKEMTIVMQEWFEDLAVMKDRFSVTLSFGGVPEPIVIPFEAIKTFVDPSVEFGLRFDAHDEAGDDGKDGGAGGGADPASPDDPRPERQRWRGREPRQVPQALSRRPAPPPAGQYSPVSIRSVPSSSRSTPSSM